MPAPKWMQHGNLSVPTVGFLSHHEVSEWSWLIVVQTDPFACLPKKPRNQDSLPTRLRSTRSTEVDILLMWRDSTICTAWYVRQGEGQYRLCD